MAVVALDKLARRYGDVDAVADLSLTIPHGEFVALLGPSGCGKTTTLQMIAGFVEPTGGDITIDSRSMLGVPPHMRNIGVVFQSYALFPHLSVFDNVAFGLRMRRVETAEIAKRVQRALGMVQLGALDARFPRELSGGQQQRVALARALVIEPSVLLLDEPLSNLDANLREQMRFEIREIQRRIGITTVFVTHDQNEAMAAADRLVIMSKGRIRQVGTARDVYETPADMFVAAFIGQANILRGRIDAIDGGSARIRLADGSAVAARMTRHFPAGTAVCLALRPEDIVLAETARPGFNAVGGKVARVNYLGATVHAAVQVGDLTLTVTRPRGEPVPAEGQTVVASWRPDTGVVLAENAG